MSRKPKAGWYPDPAHPGQERRWDGVQWIDERRDAPPLGTGSDNKVLPTSDSIKAVGGLIAVVVGVLAICALGISTMAFIDSDKDANSMIPLATAAFGVISAIVGAYLGIKIGTDQSANAAQDASQAHEKLAANAAHDLSQAHAKLAAIQSFVPADKQQDAQAAAERAT